MVNHREEPEVESIKADITILRNEIEYLTELNERQTVTIQSLLKALYGDVETLGIVGRQRQQEQSLKLFWFALTTIGSTSLAMLGDLIVNYLLKR